MTDLPATPTPSPKWKLVWSDEFDGSVGSSPDPAKWQFNLGGQGWGNQEWEYYTDKPENAMLDGEGNLVITARQLDDPAGRGLHCWYGPCLFTSARLLTLERFEFTYGRVEGRLKLPYGQGIWPAFWMLGSNFPTSDWPGCGEIDIMDLVGRQPATVYGAAHGPGYSGENSLSSAYSLPEGQLFQDDFHLFVVEWEENAIRWYVDGQLYATLNKSQLPQEMPWVFDHPFFIILNVAVGGGWPGYPDETSTFPQRMQVDYVRVYQRP